MGTVLWNLARHAAGGDQAHAIAVDDQANVYVTGESLGVGYSNFLTIKYDTNGQQKWTRRYRRPGTSYAARATDIAVDKAGNVYVTGHERLDRNADLNYLTIKYNKRGKRMWVRRLRGAAYRNNTANAIVVDGSGNVYVTGEAWKSNAHSDAVTVKYDTFGVRKWVRRYNGSANGRDYANGIALDSKGNILVTGYATVEHGLKGTDPDYFTIKYAPNGKRKWLRLYNGPVAATDFARAVAVDSNDNVLVTGQSSSKNGADYLTIKYNSRGDRKWLRRYNGKGNLLDAAKAVAVDGRGNVYVTGESTGSSASGVDYATIKYTGTGKRQWVKRYDGPVNGIDRANAIAVDAAGAVHVTGDSFGKANTFDMLTIKYR